MKYESQNELKAALKKAAKGAERAAILYEGKNRKLVQSSGANVTLYSGEKKEGKTIKEQLEDVYVLLIERLNARTGIRDGVGALGGLSERTTALEFAKLCREERMALAGIKDDVVIEKGKPVLTTDIDVIRINNVKRETREELGNLGVSSSLINFDEMKLVEMKGVTDDNFLLNIWDGEGDVWAINPYCHMLKVKEDVIESLLSAAKQKEEHSEVNNLRKMPLFEALKHYGERGGEVQTNDGRNAENDYRYVHEWLAAWAIASEILDHDDEKMIELMKEVQSDTPWKIDFKSAAEKMGKDLSFVAEVLKIKPQTIIEMQKVQPKKEICFSDKSNTL